MRLTRRNATQFLQVRRECERFGPILWTDSSGGDVHRETVNVITNIEWLNDSNNIRAYL